MSEPLSIDGLKIHDPFYSDTYMTPEECKFLCDWFNEHLYMWTVGSDDEYIGIRLININNMEVRDLICKAMYGIIADIKVKSGVSVLPEMITLNRWHVGSLQPPHTDLWSTQEMFLSDTGYMPHTPSRQWTSIFYLNDDFSGGQTYVPEELDDPDSKEMVYDPQVGQGLTFQGIYVKHGVKKVRRNYRYTISYWFTTEVKKQSSMLLNNSLGVDEDILRLQMEGKPIPTQEERDAWYKQQTEKEKHIRKDALVDLSHYDSIKKS